MRRGPYLALAVGCGYLLGRRRRLTAALTLGAAAALGRASGPDGPLRRGAQALGSSPELGNLAGLGQPLVRAGKTAVRTALNSRLDSLSDRLRDGGKALRDGGEALRDGREALRRPRRHDEEKDGPGDAEDTPLPESDPGSEEPYEEDDEDVGARPRRRTARERGPASGRPPRQRRQPRDVDPGDGYDDDGYEADEQPGPATASRPVRRRQPTGGAPVRRRDV